MTGTEQNPTSNASTREPAAFHGAFAAGVAIAASGALWFGFASAPLVGGEDALVRGLLLALAIWLLATAHTWNAAVSRREAERLEAAQADTSMLAPVGSGSARSALRWLSPTALVLGAVALAGALALRFAPSVQQHLDPADLRLLGAGSIVVLWILALGATWKWWQATTRRLRREGAEGNAALAQAAMARLPVMISLCTPDGRRVACNDRFAEVFKRSPDDLDEGKWREFVHQSDRSSFDTIFERDPGGFSPVAVEYGVTTPGGDNHWIREQFVPERVHGVLHGYIAVGVDITSQVRNETEYVEQIDALKEESEKRALDAARLEDERDAARTECRQQESNLRAEKERSRKKDESLKSAREQRDKARADLKESRAAGAAIKAESSRLTGVIARLEGELEQAGDEVATLDAKCTKQAERIEQYKTDAVEARRQESQLRAKIKRLTEETQQQADQIESLGREREDADAAASDLQSRLEREVSAAVEAARDPIRSRINAVHHRLSDAAAGAPAHGALDAIESSLAIVESIGALVSDAEEEEPEAGGARERAFDLREVVRDAGRIVQAIGVGPRVEAEIERDFPASVYGDAYRVRAAVQQMGALLVGRPGVDSLTLRLTHTGVLPSMVSVRIELVAHGEGLDADAVGRSIAPNDQSHDSRETAFAWSRFASMEGEHGAEAADPNTLTVWLTTSFMRRMTGEAASPQAAAPDPTESQAADDLPPLSQAARLSQPAPQVEPPRIPQEDHECSLGQVLELGQATARIRATRSLSGGVIVRFTAAGGKQVEAPAQVESCRKLGPRRFDALLRFSSLSDETKAQLRKIAMMNRRLTTFVSRDEPAA
jgi:PAS domain S-box-containing protein